MVCYDKKSAVFDFESEDVLLKAHSVLLQNLQGSSMKRGEMVDDYILRAFRSIDADFIQSLQANARHYLLPMAEYLK